jgi:RND family efflux transporter MFP subunit
MLRLMNVCSVLVLLGLAAVTGCHQDSRTSPHLGSEAPVAIRVAAVESRHSQAVEEVVGSVRSKLHAGVEARTSGKIERMLVVPGQLVKAGELLIEVDARELQARLDQAMAVGDQARQELKRATGLLNEKTISQQEYDLAHSRERVAAAAVIEGETMLGYARITAPFSGVITRKLADVGDLAMPGKVLLELEDPSVLRLEAGVPEALVDHVQLDARFGITIPSLKESLEGICSELTPVADPSSRTFLVKFDLPALKGLRVGQFGRVAIPVGEGAALRIPFSAVVQRGQMELVFVASDNRAHLRLVRTGKRIGNEVEVVSGLSTNEVVASENAASLQDGQAVEIR